MIFSPILVFATVPDSSINSWDSWFIFSLRKNKHLLLHENSLHVYTWGGISKSYLLSRCCITMWLFCFWDVNQLIMWQQGWYLLWFPLWDLYIHYLGNVHTWAIFFLRPLANTSSMVPLWASTDSGFVPNLGPVSEATPSGGGCL